MRTKNAHHAESHTIKPKQTNTHTLGSSHLQRAAKAVKQFYNRKRRMFLKNPNNFDKI